MSWVKSLAKREGHAALPRQPLPLLLGDQGGKLPLVGGDELPRRGAVGLRGLLHQAGQPLRGQLEGGIRIDQGLIPVHQGGEGPGHRGGDPGDGVIVLGPQRLILGGHLGEAGGQVYRAQIRAIGVLPAQHTALHLQHLVLQAAVIVQGGGAAQRHQGLEDLLIHSGR